MKTTTPIYCTLIPYIFTQVSCEPEGFTLLFRKFPMHSTLITCRHTYNGQRVFLAE